MESDSKSPCTMSAEYPDKLEWNGEEPNYVVINHIVNKHGDYLLTMGIQKTAYIHRSIQSALENMEHKIRKLEDQVRDLTEKRDHV